MKYKTYTGMSAELVIKYLNGEKIESYDPNKDTWHKVVTYMYPDDMHRISNPDKTYRVREYDYPVLGEREIIPAMRELAQKVFKDQGGTALSTEELMTQAACYAYLQAGVDME